MIQSQEKPGQLKNEKGSLKRWGGRAKKKKEKRSYILDIFSTCLRNLLQNFFIQILLPFFPFI